MMDFTPTKAMIYVSKLRAHLHNRIAKRGLRAADIYFLRKIYLFEATRFSKNYTQSLDLFRLSDALFGAAVVRGLKKGKILLTKLSGKGEYTVNSRLFEIAVGTLAESAQTNAVLRFFALSDGVLLGVSRVSRKPEIIFPGAVSFFCLPNGPFYLFIPLEKSRADTPVKSETEYLLDRYSAFNVFSCQ